VRPAPPAGAGPAGPVDPVLSALTDGRAWPLRVALLLAGAAVLLFPGLGAAPLERAEIYFLDGARSMVERHDLLVPYYRAEPFFDKPPLTYWLMAGTFELFGFGAGAARLVPAVSALCVLLATLWLGSVLFDRRTAWIGALVLATTGAFLAFGRVAMSDMLLALWTTLAMALGVRAARGDAPDAWPVALAVTLGLGFLTKGPIALLLPGLGLLWLAWTRRASLPRLRPLVAAVAAIAFVVIAGGWFVLVQRRLGWGPLEHFFLRENLQRFAASTYDSQQPFWFYLTAYLAEGAPWSLFLPLAAFHAWRRATRDEGSRFLLVWLAMALVPLSLSRGKIDYYLLPLYPAAALVVARFFVTIPWQARERGWARVVLGLAAVALAAVPTFLFLVPAPWAPPRVALVALALLFAIAVAAALWTIARPEPTRTVGTLAAASALVIGCLGDVVVPALHDAQPHEWVVDDVRREMAYRPDLTVIACADPARVQRDLLFHARAVVDERCDLWAVASSDRPFLFLLGPGERESLLGADGVREIARYRYLPATVLTLEGLLARPQPSEMTLAANFATTDPIAEIKRKRDRKRALRNETDP
jgi:dolichol-phosphate mannosyltransferase